MHRCLLTNTYRLIVCKDKSLVVIAPIFARRKQYGQLVTKHYVLTRTDTPCNSFPLRGLVVVVVVAGTGSSPNEHLLVAGKY